MKHSIQLIALTFVFLLTSCNSDQKHVQSNIEKYSNTWDDVINHDNLEAINDSNFDENVIIVSSPENVVGIDGFKSFYANFVNGFSNKEFTIVDIFGQRDKLVKHWKFKGTNSGEFFGMPPTGKDVDIEGTTLVEMKDGKITKEQDFFDNMVFMQQLGIASSPDNVSIIESIYNSFGAGDIDGVLATFDPKIVWNEAENFPYADGNPYIGGEAIVNGVFARLGGEWDNWNLTDLQLHDMSNNMVLATGRYNATYKKNSEKLDVQMVHLWTLNNGKVIRFQQYTDTKGVANTMGK